ncbi:MAG: hypothetical protein ABR981_03585 [Candidatus Micrarchaeaceae archaeon]
MVDTIPTQTVEAPSNKKGRVSNLMTRAWQRMRENDSQANQLDSSYNLSSSTQRQFSKMLKNYDTAATRKGISDSINSMIDDARKYCTDESRIASITEEAAKNLINEFSSRAAEKFFNKTAEKLRKYVREDSREIISRNVTEIAYDPAFKYDRIYYNLKNYKESKPNKMATDMYERCGLEPQFTRADYAASTIICIYENNKEYETFFRDKLGVRFPGKPSFFLYNFARRNIRDLSVSGEFDSQSRDILINPYIYSAGSHGVSRIAIHELVHFVQCGDKSEEEFESYSRHPNSSVPNDPKLEEMLTHVVYEAGTQLGVFFYDIGSSISKNKFTDSYHILKAMIEDSDNILDPYRDDLSIQSAKALVEAMYNVLKNPKDGNPHKALYDLIKKDYPKSSQVNYGMSLALASLVYTCNAYEMRATISDLMQLDEPCRVVEKLSRIIQNDVTGDILYGIKHLDMRRNIIP